MSGSKRPDAYWGEIETPVTFFQLKGIIESLNKRFHLNPADFGVDEISGYQKHTAFQIRIDGERLGSAGELNLDYLKTMDVTDTVWAAELDLQKLFSLVTANWKYSPIPRFPAVKRDLSVVVDETLPAGDLLERIRKIGGGSLVVLDLFDLYRGESIPKDKKSLAFALTFQSQDQTLTEEDIDPIMARIIRDLAETCGAALRT